MNSALERKTIATVPAQTFSCFMEEGTWCGDGEAKNWDCMYMETVYLGKWHRVSVNIRNPFSFGDAEW
jgi:hypothetical protein